MVPGYIYGAYAGPVADNKPGHKGGIILKVIQDSLNIGSPAGREKNDIMILHIKDG